MEDPQEEDEGPVFRRLTRREYESLEGLDDKEAIEECRKLTEEFERVAKERGIEPPSKRRVQYEPDPDEDERYEQFRKYMNMDDDTIDWKTMCESYLARRDMEVARLEQYERRREWEREQLDRPNLPRNTQESFRQRVTGNVQGLRRGPSGSPYHNNDGDTIFFATRGEDFNKYLEQQRKDWLHANKMDKQEDDEEDGEYEEDEDDDEYEEEDEDDDEYEEDDEGDDDADFYPEAARVPNADGKFPDIEHYWPHEMATLPTDEFLRRMRKLPNIDHGYVQRKLADKVRKIQKKQQEELRRQPSQEDVYNRMQSGVVSHVASAVGKADQKAGEKNRSPEQVVQLVCKALQYNDHPKKNRGMEVLRDFSSPISPFCQYEHSLESFHGFMMNNAAMRHFFTTTRIQVDPPAVSGKRAYVTAWLTLKGSEEEIPAKFVLSKSSALGNRGWLIDSMTVRPPS